MSNQPTDRISRRSIKTVITEQVVPIGAVVSMVLAVGSLLYTNAFGGTASLAQRMDTSDECVMKIEHRTTVLEQKRDADDRATSLEDARRDREITEQKIRLERIENKVDALLMRTRK